LDHLIILITQEIIVENRERIGLVWIEILLASTVGYFLGAISFPAIAVRLFASDEEKEKMAHPSVEVEDQDYDPVYGAYSTNRIWGPKVGVSIAVLDMAKVAIPMWIFKAILYPTEYYYLLVSIAAVIGHNWPIYTRFKGGRGVSVIFGSVFVVDWLAPLPLIFMGAILGLLVARNVQLAYFGSAFLLFPWLWIRTGDLIILGWAFVMIMIMWISMAPDRRTGKRIEEERGEDAANEAMDVLLPGTRGMRRAIERLESMGSRKYAFSLIGLIVLFAVFWFLPLLPI
jgi:glycerol-3-phosphate acyltransferase PlsY